MQSMHERKKNPHLQEVVKTKAKFSVAYKYQIIYLILNTTYVRALQLFFLVPF